MAKRTKSNTAGLAAALRRRIGRTVWFLHPTPRRSAGHAAPRAQGRSARTHDDPAVGRTGGGRTYVMDERTYTLPRSVKINFGPTPIEVKK
jgi:hypothetical protein